MRTCSSSAADDYGFDIVTGPQRKYSGRLSVRMGDFYDGERVNLGGEFAWKQSRYFTLRLAYDWNDVDLPQERFITRLSRATAEVSLSSRLNWISLFQYDDVSEVFGIQSRLTWTPQAGQEMFLVFNRNFQDFDKDGRLQSIDSDLSAKISYTFRFCHGLFHDPRKHLRHAVATGLTEIVGDRRCKLRDGVGLHAELAE